MVEGGAEGIVHAFPAGLAYPSMGRVLNPPAPYGTPLDVSRCRRARPERFWLKAEAEGWSVLKVPEGDVLKAEASAVAC